MDSEANQQYDIVLEYGTPLFKRAAKRYVMSLAFRSKVLIVLLVICLAIAAVLMTGLTAWAALNARLCAMTPLYKLFIPILVLLVLVPLLYWLTYIRTIRNCEQLAKKMTDRSYRMTFTEEGMQAQSELGKAEVSWKSFFKLLTGSDIWLLFANQHSFYMLPTEQLSPEAQAFIQDKLREAGINIV